jgi:hypothetical protein
VLRFAFAFADGRAAAAVALMSTACCQVGRLIQGIGLTLIPPVVEKRTASWHIWESPPPSSNSSLTEGLVLHHRPLAGRIPLDIPRGM